MPDKDCPLCRAKIGLRITHQHSPTHFRSPANRHGGQPGWWHDVRWSQQYSTWQCDSRCKGGFGKMCPHIEAVLAILRDEFQGWLGAIPRRPRVAVEEYPIDRALTDALVESRPGKRLEDIFPD